MPFSDFLQPWEGYDAVAGRRYESFVIGPTTSTAAGNIFTFGKRQSVYDTLPIPFGNPAKWKCAHCGRKNKPDRETCVACGAPDLT